MIIINDTTYIMDPTEVSTVTASYLKIIIRFKGRDGWHSVPSTQPKEDSLRLSRLILKDARSKSAGVVLEERFTTNHPAV